MSSTRQTNNSIRFSLEEVFEMAKKIERNGYHFYLKAAEGCPKYKDFLLELAEQEKGHENTFDKLADKILSEKDNFLNNDQSMEAITYIEAIADNSVFLLNENPEQLFSQYDNPKEVFKQALARESDTILFFLGIREMMINQEQRKIIDELVGEEMKHIAWIKKNIPKE